MRALVAALLLLAPAFLPAGLCFAAVSSPPPAAVEFLPLQQVRAGMHGVAYTVFQGAQPEPVELEVLGVEKDINGPRQDLILVRLLGSKPEYTGVAAGMSGSPVYLEGKLAGAISYRIGEFSKEPIAGVTPIAEMLEVGGMERSPSPAAASASPAPSAVPGDSAAVAGLGLLQPISAPLVFSGFDPDAIRSFAPRFAAAGITAVVGAGSVTGEPQPEPLQPGSAVSMLLVQGDMNIAATCTVTYVDATHLLACGHPIMQFGAIDVPMTKARVLATLPSAMASFKIVNATEPVGAFVEDRHGGILGRFGARPRMIPVTLSVRDGARQQPYHFQVLDNPQITPVALMATVYSALHSLNDYSAETTYRVDGAIAVRGYPDVDVHSMFAPADAGPPPAMTAALSLGQRFSRLLANPASNPEIKSVNLQFTLAGDRRSALLETARTEVTQARPGDAITLEAVLRPYRGERLVRRLRLRIPTSTPPGTLRILVSDGSTLDRMRGFNPNLTQRLDLAATIALLNQEHANNRLYVSLLEPDPQALVEDKVMPSLPLSIMNVMQGLRGSQDMVVTGESAVSEDSLAFDYQVSGAQIVSLEIK